METRFTESFTTRQCEGKNFIIFTVNGKGLVTMNATMDGAQNIDSSGVMFGAQGSLIAKCSENTQEHVACHVTSEAKTKWSVDITFDSKVSAMVGSNKELDLFAAIGDEPLSPLSQECSAG